MKKTDKVLRLLFSSAALLLLITLAVTYLVGMYVVRWNRSMAFERAVIQHLTQLSSTIKDAETGQRGYILTGKPSYLAPYQDAVRRLHVEQESLHVLVRNGDLQAKDIENLDQHIASKMAELDQTIELRKTNYSRPSQSSNPIAASSKWTKFDFW